MLKIRLQRTGRTNDPSYRVVVTEHTNGPKAGKAVENVGFYNPKTKERTLNGERIQYWISKGAKASGTMHNMLISAGITSGKKVNVLPKKTVPAVAPEAEKKEESPAAEAPVAEAPAEEALAEETKGEEASAQA